MIVVASVSILAVLLAFLDSRKILPHGLILGFILVTFLGCVHYDYGNDYPVYFKIYYDVVSQPFSWGGLLSGDLYNEIGWAALCLLFKPLGGFFVMVGALNIFQNVLVYKGIKHFVERQWRPVAFFIYLFAESFYLLNFSMMRQGLVVCVFFGLWPWILQRKVLKTFGVLCFCCLVHSSAIILLPFAFWGWVSMKNGKKIAKRLFVAFWGVWVLSFAIKAILAMFSFLPVVMIYLDNYGDDDSKVTFGMGYFLKQIPFVLSLLFLISKDKRITPQQRSVVTLSSFNNLLAPLASAIPLTGRLTFYFGIYQLIAIPLVYKGIHNPIKRLSLLLVFEVYMLYCYQLFFNSPIWMDMYANFNTIFSLF